MSFQLHFRKGYGAITWRGDLKQYRWGGEAVLVHAPDLYCFDLRPIVVRISTNIGALHPSLMT